ncbi:MAG: BatD family protein, partial [Thermoanaerobaculia bacterium]|nr:BatD family protein [Thermoanaerobaculia bacterium]
MRTLLNRTLPAGLLALILIAVTGDLRAHEISFDRSTIRTDDFVSLTITLEGSFIDVDHVKLPLDNLVLVAGPSTSTEFRWVNGETSRRRVLTYRLRPEEAGIGAVGPVELTAPNGDQLRLKRVTVRVVDPARTDVSDERAISLGRLPLIVAEVSKRKAWVGEQIEVRWLLYGENLRGVQVLELPPLDGFWVEQLDFEETTREVIRVGGELIQRQTLRHSLLYPIRSGTYEIEPLRAAVRVYRRNRF